MPSREPEAEALEWMKACATLLRTMHDHLAGVPAGIWDPELVPQMGRVLTEIHHLDDLRVRTQGRIELRDTVAHWEAVFGDEESGGQS